MKNKILLTIVITAVLTGLLFFTVAAFILRPVALDIEAVDLNTVEDGEYIGICQNKILLAVVRVSVIDRQIAQIEILEHKESYMAQARTFSDSIIMEQSLEVDAVSGATLTSDTVRKAVEDALNQSR